MNQNQKKNTVLINENIRFPKVIVIDDVGENLGVMPIANALELANKKNLDLVIISNKTEVPITKILDYGKFKYEQKRKLKQNQKNQVTVKVKEIKVKPMIGTHDLEVRVNNARKWLLDGDRVSFIIQARGRMATKVDFINEVHNKFITLLGDDGKLIQDRKKVNDYRYESIIVSNKK